MLLIIFCAIGIAQLTIDDKATIVRIEDGVENSSWEEMFEYNTYRTLSFEKDGWLYTLSYEPLKDEEYNATRFAVYNQKTESYEIETQIHIKVDKVDNRVIKLYGTKKV